MYLTERCEVRSLQGRDREAENKTGQDDAADAEGVHEGSLRAQLRGQERVQRRRAGVEGIGGGGANYEGLQRRCQVLQRCEHEKYHVFWQHHTKVLRSVCTSN